MAKHPFDPVVRQSVYDKYSGCCAYCGCDLLGKFQVDHFIPKRRYKYKDWNFNKCLEIGKDIIENYMPCCCSCNSSKSDLSLEQFRDRIYDRVDRLNKYSSEYNIAKRFGLVQEIKSEVIFHFEIMENNG